MSGRLVLLLIVFCAIIAAFVAGAAVQRFYGLGNLLKMVDTDYVPPDHRMVLPMDALGRVVVIMLAGQSNMQGSGRIGEYEPLYTDGRVFTFGDDFKWRVAEEPLSGDGVGPGLAFAAHVIRREPGLVIGLVPCARGGTNIAQWQRDRSPMSLYGKCLMRMQAAAVAGAPGAILFLQGENDTEGDPEDHVDDWHRQFEQFVDDMRTDLGIPHLPVVYGQIGSGDGERWKAVKRSQEQVNLANAEMVVTDDLSFYPGDVHFTTQSQMEIGKRMAEAYFHLHDNF